MIRLAVAALVVGIVPAFGWADVSESEQSEAFADQSDESTASSMPHPQPHPINVRVVNFPETQSVEGTVEVSNLPLADDGGVLISCPSTQPTYQFYGDTFGGPVLLTESTPALEVGDFIVAGAANATLFWEVTPQIGSAVAYDVAVIVEGYFDGPPSIKVFESEVTSYSYYPAYFCSGQGHPEIGPVEGSGTGTVQFSNSIGLPQIRFVVRVEHRQRSLCNDVSYPIYQGAAPTSIDVSVDTMSVFIR